jgi:hypothetical protein
MVQAVENRAELAGDLLASRPDPDRAGHRLLTVRVREVIPHETLPNLLEGLEGKTIEIVSPEGPGAPGPVRLAVKRAGPATYVALKPD